MREPPGPEPHHSVLADLSSVPRQTICLQPCANIFPLDCAHRACVPCLARYSLGKLEVANATLPGCPTCAATLSPDALQRLLERASEDDPTSASTTSLPASAWPPELRRVPSADRAAAIRDFLAAKQLQTNATTVPPPAPVEGPREQAAFRAWARREHG